MDEESKVIEINEISDDQHKELQNSMKRTIYKHILHDVNNALTWRIRWAKLSVFFGLNSEILMVVVIILCFASGASSEESSKSKLAFLGGVFNILAFSLNRLNSFSKNESSVKTQMINKYSKMLI